jgi:hypothetical protein
VVVVTDAAVVCRSSFRWVAAAAAGAAADLAAEAEALVDSVEEEGSPVAAADRRGEYQLQ